MCDNDSPELQELYAHIRARHRYEPTAFLGWDEDRITARQRFLGWKSAHANEHRGWQSFWSDDEWEILKHPVGSRDATPNERVSMMNLDDGSFTIL